MLNLLWSNILLAVAFIFFNYKSVVFEILSLNCAYVQFHSTTVEEELKDLSEKRKDSRNSSVRSSSSSNVKKQDEKEKVPSVGYHKLVSW